MPSSNPKYDDDAAPPVAPSVPVSYPEAETNWKLWGWWGL